MKAPHSSTAPAATQSMGTDLWQRLVHVYDGALASGALFKTESTDQFMPAGGIEFIVRVAGSLREKAKQKQSKTCAAAGSCHCTAASECSATHVSAFQGL